MLPKPNALIPVLGPMALGLARPPASRRGLAPEEKFVASTALSLIGLCLLGWISCNAALPAFALRSAPLLAVAALFLNFRAFTTLFRDPTVRALLLAQLLVTARRPGRLGFVARYSGIGWADDRFEHRQRTRFRIDHGPLDQRLLGAYDRNDQPARSERSVTR